MNALLAAQVLLLAAAAACLLPLRNRLRAALGVASQVLSTALVLSVAVPVVLGGAPLEGELAWAHPVGMLKLRLDALGAFFLVWSLPMTLLGSIYAVGYLRRHFDTRRHVGVHYALLNMTSLSFVLVYTGDHALVFLLGWEIAALAAWLLVIWDYSNQKIRFAGFNYLVSTHVGLIFLVAAFMILYTHSTSWELDSFGRWLRANPGSERNLVFLLLLASFGLKSAFFPFHSWLPRAHAAAPAHVSALMSGVIHKAGLYALVRFILLIGKPDEWMGWFLIGFSLLSAVIGALYTAGQRDLKRLLGYSSTENVGIAGLGLGVGCLGLAWDNAPLTAHRLRRRAAARAEPRLLQVPALLRRRRGLPGHAHGRHRTARRPGASDAVDRDRLPDRRRGDLGAAAAQRLHQRVRHLLGAVQRPADRAMGQGGAGRRRRAASHSSARSRR